MCNGPLVAHFAKDTLGVLIAGIAARRKGARVKGARGPRARPHALLFFRFQRCAWRSRVYYLLEDEEAAGVALADGDDDGREVPKKRKRVLACPVCKM